MITFRNVELSWKRNDSLVGIKFDQQLDYFIYKVKSKGVYVLARTETEGDKHKVVLTDIEQKRSRVKNLKRICRVNKKHKWLIVNILMLNPSMSGSC